MKKILCFGELLLRMSPRTNGFWLQQHQIPVYLGGAELNVAHALAQWELPVAYCTALPNNFLADEIIQQLKTDGIETAQIQRYGKRIGLYFLEQGTDVKNKNVYFDREYSSFASIQPGMIDWEKVLESIQWLHFSAIVPALNDRLVKVCEEMLQVAIKKNIVISLDLNFRASLWQENRVPANIVPVLAKYCHVIMGNIWSANTLLGAPLQITGKETMHKSAYLYHARLTAGYILQQFPQCHTVANTFRFDTFNDGIKYYGTLFKEQQLFVSSEMHSNNVKDKVGSGDCFMAGLIFGFSHGMTPQNTLNFAAAAAFGKLHETGDTTQQTISDIHKIIQQYV
ncbi:sugar kinase [Hydrotalea sp.]|uniref:sugar kinase n=1 Tax=Hydrotalea sp. TaxID=2881279 RepID=UPI002634159C|nr:sugar kinase [Hydrotalea sp.]